MSRGSPEAVALPPVLDLLVAPRLKTLLEALLAGGGAVCLDGATVEAASTPCIQVLLAASRSLRAEGRELALAAPSPPLRSAFADLGLAAELERWEAVHEQMRADGR